MWKKSIFLFLLVTFIYPSLVCAGSLYYILDGSGSMWGRIDGTMKIVIAREVMTRLVKEMPADIDSGLTVYGHRQKGDCEDIAELIPLGPLDRTGIMAAITSVNPKGKTPIAKSIAQVVEKLKGREETTTIVLISDGIETCGGDPCAVTRALKESGLSFVLHTVGLGVDQQASEQLVCIAEAGGGAYFSVNNADELLATLSAVQNSVVSKAPVVASPRPKEIRQHVAAASSSTSIRIKAKRPGRISFIRPDWLEQPYYWKVLDPETGKEKGRFKSLQSTMIPAGEYQLAWKQYEHYSTEVILGEVITVRSGQIVELPLSTAIRLNLPSWVKQPYCWKLLDFETGAEIAAFKKLEPFLVPSGEYELVWRQDEHRTSDIRLKRVIIEADKLNDIDVATALNPVTADWVPKKIYYWGLKAVDKSGAWEWVARFREQFNPQLVTVGTYQLFYHLSEHGSSDAFLGEVEVIEGKLNEFPVNTGVSFILPDGVKFPYLIEFIELDNQGNEGRRVSLNGRYLNDTFGSVALAPGRYKITSRQKEHNSTTLTIVESFDLPPGYLVEIEL